MKKILALLLAILLCQANLTTIFAKDMKTYIVSDFTENALEAIKKGD